MVTSPPASTPALRRVIARSVIGSSHRTSRAPNQDAVSWVPRATDAAEVVLCVSDGHGSRACFRSDVGSQFAVAVACDAGRSFLAGLPSLGSDPRDVEREARQTLVPAIVDAWTQKVDEHRLNVPFTAEERDAAPVDPADRLLPYGATLLFALVTPEIALLARLGDGDMVVVSPDGQVSDPIPADERHVAGETVSLCLPNASSLTRVRCVDLAANPLALLLLATDGYGNSFADANWREVVGVDLLRRLYEHGPGWINDRLQDWLAESADTAGDDVTVGIVATSNLPPPVRLPERPATVDRVRPAPVTLDRKPPASPARSPSPSDLTVSWAGQRAVIRPGQRASLGRDASCDIRSVNEQVSRRHAEIAWGRDGWILSDTQSKWGTHCDGQPVVHQPIRGKVTAWLGPPGTGERVELEVTAPTPPTRTWVIDGGVSSPAGSLRSPPTAPADAPSSRHGLLDGSEEIDRRRPIAFGLAAVAIVGVLVLVLLGVLRRDGPRLTWEGLAATASSTCASPDVGAYPTSAPAIYPKIGYRGLPEGQAVTVVLHGGRERFEFLPQPGTKCRVVELNTQGIPGPWEVTVSASEKLVVRKQVPVQGGAVGVPIPGN